MGGIISTHLAPSFRSTRSDVIQDDIISHFLPDRKMKFGRLKEKKIEKSTKHNSVIS